MIHRTLLRAAIRTIAPTPQEQLQRAIQVAATREAQREYYAYQMRHWITIARRIDPHTDWWGFAHAKQQVQDCERELERIKPLCLAAVERIDKLRSNDNE